MANSPSQKWEDGRLVERAVETNRWRILPDGTEVGETEEVEAKATQDYKAPVPTKQMSAEDAENKSVRARRTTKKSSE
jgi:hypothetical protein